MAELDDVEAALRRSEQHLAAAQRITHCGSWELELHDLVDMNLNRLTWSDEVFRIFGYEPGGIQVTNQAFFDAVHPDDRARVAAAVQTALETGTLYSIDHRVVRPDGTIRIVHEQSELQYDAAGRPARMIGTVQDVTEQRTTEAQLVFHDRMVSIGALAAGVAHEINNPLAAVCVNLELVTAAVTSLAQRAAVTPELIDALSDQLRDARDGADRVRSIVRDLMVFSRGEELRVGPVDATEVLESALRMASHEVRRRARVIRDYAAIPLVDANEARLGQVFLNLLINAAHAIPDGAAEHHLIRLSCATDARGRVVVAIGDTGRGIPPELRSRVFAPFFTTKPVGEGTGLGLSICQRIVADLGGELDFTTEVGRGTEFRVTLPPSASDPRLRPDGEPPSVAPRVNGSHAPAPAAPAPARTHLGRNPGAAPAPAPAAAEAGAPAASARRRVLVIDDEVLLTSALETLLSDGYDVTVANEAVAALDALAAGARYDAVLCDLVMPRLTGLQLHAELRRIAPAQASRMIFMTGGAFAAEDRRALETSGLAWVEKPFALEALIGALDAVTARS